MTLRKIADAGGGETQSWVFCDSGFCPARLMLGVNPNARPRPFDQWASGSGNDYCPQHSRIAVQESSVSDSSRVEIDASRDLATIRLRTWTGALWDIDVGELTAGLIHGEASPIAANRVPTWEGVPIPDDLTPDFETAATGYVLEGWKRGVTDANNATLNGEPK